MLTTSNGDEKRILTARDLGEPSTVLQIKRNDENALLVNLRGTDDDKVLVVTSTTTIRSSDGYVHCLISWDLTLAAAARARLYLEDVNRTLIDESLNQNVRLSRVDRWTIGANNAGQQKLKANIADLFFDTQYLDLDVVANRRKFIDATGNPVNLGTTGATPFGSQPLLFHSGTTGNWHTNKGSGGGFTLNGFLETASPQPP